MRFFLLFFFVACSQTKTIEPFESVQITTASHEGSSDAIKIKKSNLDSNPENGETEKISKNIKEKPTISLSLYSSLYHSLALLNLLKSIEQEEIKISMISSHGFGSLVVALYAKERSISSVEWSLFKLLKELKDEKMYTPSWRDKVDRFIDDEFKNLRLDQLKVKLVLPQVVAGDKIDFITKGNIASILKRNLLLTAADNFLQKPDIYHYTIERFGIDINLAVSFIPETPSFEHLNGHSYGVITRLLGLVMNSQEDITLIKTTKNLSLDKIYPLADINDSYQDGVNIYVKQISQIYTKWQEDSSSGFQFQ